MNNVESFEKDINEELGEGEKLLWAGRPTAFKLLDAPYGTPVIIRWIICLILFASALWYGFIFIPSAENISVNGNVVMAIWLAITAALALWPIKSIKKIKGKCVYCITDRRAIIMIPGVTKLVKERLYSDVKEITHELYAGDIGNIYIGKKQKNSLKRARASVLIPPMGEEDKEHPLTFHSVKNPGEVMVHFPALDA